MKPKTNTLLLAALAGFLAGCAVMCLLLPRGTAPAETPAPTAQTQTMPTASAQTQPASHSPETRRQILSEIRRNKVASVDVQFFARNEFHAADGTLSQQFINFFELTPAQAGELSNLVQTTKAEMWNAAKAQAQISQTDSSRVVIKIPPLAAGPDIYDKLMSGFHAVLGDDRFNDMMLYNGRQFENLFNEFGAENRTVTIEKTEGGRYKITTFITGRPTESSATYSRTGTLDEIKQRNPELLEFIHAE